jgi:hypothetical protein
MVIDCPRFTGRSMLRPYNGKTPPLWNSQRLYGWLELGE